MIGQKLTSALMPAFQGASQPMNRPINPQLMQQIAQQGLGALGQRPMQPMTRPMTPEMMQQFNQWRQQRPQFNQQPPMGRPGMVPQGALPQGMGAGVQQGIMGVGHAFGQQPLPQQLQSNGMQRVSPGLYRNAQGQIVRG